MDLKKAMVRRRSVRCFKPELPSEAELVSLVDAAGLAPSAGNKQPYRFLVVRSKELIRTAALAVEQESGVLLEEMDPIYRQDFRDYAAHFLIFRDAPVVMAPIYRPIAGFSKLLKPGADEKTRAALTTLEERSSLMSVSLSIQNLLLQAEAMGLGACCMTGPLVAAENLRTCLRVPEGWDLAALIALGYPDEEPKNPGRKRVKSIVKWL